MRPDFVTIAEAAALLDCSEKTVRRLVRSGAIPALKDGSFIRVLYSKLIERVETSTLARPPAPSGGQMED